MAKKKITRPLKRAEAITANTAPEKAPPAQYPLSHRAGLYMSTGLLLVMSVILFSAYIFSDRLMLFKDIGTDMINLSWPDLHYYSLYFRHEGIPRWSFETGLGQNIFPAALGDIEVALLYLAPTDWMPRLFVYGQIFKMLLSGIFFYLFLRKAGLGVYASITGSVLYGFSGFMIVGGGWEAFSTEACYLALLLLGVELLRKDNNLLVFPVAVALESANNPVLFYLAGLLAASYLLFTFLLKGSFKTAPLLIGKMLLLGLLGLGMAAFLIQGELHLITMSPRGSGNSASYAKTLSSHSVFGTESGIFYLTFLLRMLGNDMAGYGNEVFRGWYNYLEAPMQYCSLLSLLLFPQVFALGSKKLKWLAGIALAVAVIPVLFPWFRYAFWLFSGDYFRTYSLFFDVLQILLAVVALELILRLRKINLPLLAAVWAALSIVLFTVSISPENLRLPVFVFLSAEALLLWMITRPGLFTFAWTVLPLVVISEILYLSWGAYNVRETMVKSELADGVGYRDSTLVALNLIRSTDHGFYRIHKNYASGLTPIRSHNDALMQDFCSSPSYRSFNQKYYVDFLQRMHLITDTTSEGETRWINGVGQNPLTMLLTSNKYLLFRGPTRGLSSIGYDSITNINGIQVFKNRFFVPLGFTYAACISDAELNKTGNQREVMLLKGVEASDNLLQHELSGLPRLTVADTLHEDYFRDLEALSTGLKKDTLQITSFSENRVEGNIHTDSSKLLFFSIPYDDGWKAKIDGKEVKTLLVNYGFIGYMIDKGNHKIELRYVPPYYRASMGVSLFSIFCFMLLLFFSMKNRVRKNRAGAPA